MGSLTRMIFSPSIEKNTFYYFFLKGVLYLIQHLPTSYGKYILISIKHITQFYPYSTFVSCPLPLYLLNTSSHQKSSNLVKLKKWKKPPGTSPTSGQYSSVVMSC